MLTKSVNPAIERVRDGYTHVRIETTVLEDGVPLDDPSYRRYVLSPGDDLTHQDPRVALVALAASVPLAALPQAVALLTPLVPKAAVQLSPT